ncbi:MAG: HAMP domain-containing protein [Chloroflexi bacterium]|nr:HAMP domain-containing protein [Chloroflexota bacterium]
MRISLTAKWVLSIALASLVGMVVAAVVVNSATSRDFDRLRIEREVEDVSDAAVIFFQQQGSLDGFMSMSGRGQGMHYEGTLGRVVMPPGVVLLDIEGEVVSGLPGASPDGLPFELTLNTLSPVTLDDGTLIGQVALIDAGPPLDPRDQLYLDNTARALMIGALGAAAVAVAVGAVLAGVFLRPLRALNTAIHAVERGDLKQHIPVRGSDELADVIRAFNRMSAELDRVNALRRQMTADIAHDLRTPLTVIRGYLEAMTDGALPPSPERLAAIRGEVTTLHHLIEDLRTLSLADAGELRLQRQPIQPAALLSDVRESFALQAEARGVTLEVDAAPDLPPVAVDPLRMTQVFGNLVSNALRHTPPGGHVMLLAAPSGPNVEFTVEDTGEGIPPEQLAHIFERFYRGEASRQQQEGESGLGLAIVRSLVEAHGGTIRAESAPGNGTRMTIALTPQLLGSR